MLIGGDYYKHGGYGIEKSWLFSEEPEKYLLKEEDLLDDEPTNWIIAFILNALKADFPNLILEIPWIYDSEMRRKKTGIVIKKSQGPIVYFKKPETGWNEARKIREFLWREIPESWDANWFIKSLE